mmetsp:Transcript_63126/g.186517  ORF Transcript_63126/g.186517 Transcript_63126/m.186517 type:complete len:215 (-) Transcript_63126:1993-2637(-)
MSSFRTFPRKDADWTARARAEPTSCGAGGRQMLPAVTLPHESFRGRGRTDISNHEELTAPPSPSPEIRGCSSAASILAKFTAMSPCDTGSYDGTEEELAGGDEKRGSDTVLSYSLRSFLPMSASRFNIDTAPTDETHRLSAAEARSLIAGEATSLELDTISSDSTPRPLLRQMSSKIISRWPSADSEVEPVCTPANALQRARSAISLVSTVSDL